MSRYNRSQSSALTAIAIGAALRVAVAIGGLAIVDLVIKSAAIQKATIDTLEIRNLEVANVRVGQITVTNSLKLPARETPHALPS